MSHLKETECIENFIIEEYKHASAYTIHMLDERANVYTLYLATFSIIASALGFFIKSSEELTKFIPYLPYVFISLGVIHAVFFVRLGYIDKKYNSYLLRMEKIRKFILKQADAYKNEFTDIRSTLSPIVMPKTFGVVYPLFPATAVFAGIAITCFGFFSHLIWKNWFISVGTVLFSMLLFYLIAKSDRTG